MADKMAVSATLHSSPGELQLGPLLTEMASLHSLNHSKHQFEVARSIIDLCTSRPLASMVADAGCIEALHNALRALVSASDGSASLLMDNSTIDRTVDAGKAKVVKSEERESNIAATEASAAASASAMVDVESTVSSELAFLASVRAVCAAAKFIENGVALVVPVVSAACFFDEGVFGGVPNNSNASSSVGVSTALSVDIEHQVVRAECGLRAVADMLCEVKYNGTSGAPPGAVNAGRTAESWHRAREVVVGAAQRMLRGGRLGTDSKVRAAALSALGRLVSCCDEREQQHYALVTAPVDVIHSSSPGVNVRVVETTLVAFIADSDPRVRLAALVGLRHISRHAALAVSDEPLCGFRFSASCFTETAALLSDDADAAVRSAALKLLVLCAIQDPSAPVVGRHAVRRVDDAFVKVCARMTDISTHVRALAGTFMGMLAKHGVSLDLMLQVLSKEVLTGGAPNRSGDLQLGRSSRRVREAARRREGKASAQGQYYDPHTAEGDVDLSIFGIDNAAPRTSSERDLWLSDCVGSAVLGLEDERYEVRAATISSLEILARYASTAGGATAKSVEGSALKAQKFVIASADFLVDMLNDEIETVRLSGIKSLSSLLAFQKHDLPEAARVQLTEEQLQLVLSALEDKSAVARHAIHGLLAMISLRSPVSLLTTVRSVISNLLRHTHGPDVTRGRKFADSPFHQELRSAFSCLAGLGRNHAEFCCFLVRSLLEDKTHRVERHSVFKPVEQAVGDLRYVASVIPLLNAAVAENRDDVTGVSSRRCPQIVSMLPGYVFKHLSVLRETYEDIPGIFPANLQPESVLTEQRSTIDETVERVQTPQDALSGTLPFAGSPLSQAVSTSAQLLAEAYSLVDSGAPGLLSTGLRYLSRTAILTRRASRVHVCLCSDCSQEPLTREDSSLHTLWARSSLCQALISCVTTTDELFSNIETYSTDTPVRSIVEQLLMRLFVLEFTHRTTDQLMFSRADSDFPSAFRLWRCLVAAAECKHALRVHADQTYNPARARSLLLSLYVRLRSQADSKWMTQQWLELLSALQRVLMVDDEEGDRILTIKHETDEVMPDQDSTLKSGSDDRIQAIRQSLNECLCAWVPGKVPSAIWKALGAAAGRDESVQREHFKSPTVLARSLVDLVVPNTSRDSPLSLKLRAPNDSLNSRVDFTSVTVVIPCTALVHNLPRFSVGRLAALVIRPSRPWLPTEASVLSLLPVTAVRNAAKRSVRQNAMKIPTNETSQGRDEAVRGDEPTARSDPSTVDAVADETMLDVEGAYGGTLTPAVSAAPFDMGHESFLTLRFPVTLDPSWVIPPSAFETGRAHEDLVVPVSLRLMLLCDAESPSDPIPATTRADDTILGSFVRVPLSEPVTFWMGI